jgi:hypothetical protein
MHGVPTPTGTDGARARAQAHHLTTNRPDQTTTTPNADRPWSSAKEDTRRVPRRDRHASPGDEPKVKAVDVATCPVATGLPARCQPLAHARPRARDYVTDTSRGFPPARRVARYSSNMYGRRPQASSRRRVMHQASATSRRFGWLAMPRMQPAATGSLAHTSSLVLLTAGSRR